jgi:hypothetical protein
MSSWHRHCLSEAAKQWHISRVSKQINRSRRCLSELGDSGNSEPRAALRGLAPSLCPGLVCYGLSGLFGQCTFWTMTGDGFELPVSSQYDNKLRPRAQARGDNVSTACRYLQAFAFRMILHFDIRANGSCSWSTLILFSPFPVFRGNPSPSSLVTFISSLCLTSRSVTKRPLF